MFDTNTIKLMRIPFSYFLMPVFFFALSQANNINTGNAILCFIVLHLFIYPASNGYNSYMDQDEGSIGGLKNPPKPTRNLFYTSLLFDFAGLALALFVNVYFFFSVAAYLLASRAYSYKGIRLKRFPILGFLTVIFFQGGFTFWMLYNAISSERISFNKEWISLLAACSFLIAGVYPLTQIYQHEADAKSGDITISYMLKYRGTFIFTALMFICANVLLYYFFQTTGNGFSFMLFQFFLFPVVLYFIYWFVKVIRDERQASFENTMRMNLLASTFLNLCFITLFLIKYIK
jgi:1,4-dihydroxy-2-naphthoate octaprenyltransferase